VALDLSLIAHTLRALTVLLCRNGIGCHARPA
jgi:hypothetical protein